MSNLSELVRKLTRAIDKRRGVRLDADELDVIIEHGAYEALVLALGAETKRVAQERMAARATESPGQPIG
jgi:hypothetical protein